MDRRIFAAEVSHENAPLRVREQLVFDDTVRAAMLAELKKELDEVFILSTCNRFVIYGVGRSIAPLVNFFSGRPDISPYVRYFANSENTIHHLFATACGLCSQVKGDQQILSQLKDAYHFALTHQSLGIILDNLLRKAIGTGKHIRTETGIDKFCTSVADVGFLILTEKMPHIRQRNFLMIGTGKIARLSLDWMQQQGIRKARIVSHDPAKARAVAEKYGFTATGIENTHRYIREADVIIGGSHPEFTLLFDALESSRIRRAINRSPKQKIILDFGVPRNFDDSLRHYPGVELYDLDDLKAMAGSPLDAMGGIEKAWGMITEETFKFQLILRQLNVSPVLSAYWNRLVDIKDRELDWLFPKLGSISKKDKELIEKYAYKLIRSISKDPLKNIRAMANNGGAQEAAEAVKRLYNLKNITLNLSDN